MRPDILLISEMIDAAEQARQLAVGVSATDLERDRQRRDALLWNFTVLGEAAARLSDGTRARFRTFSGSSLRGCATGSCTATGRSTLRSCTRPRPNSCRSSSATCVRYSPCSTSRDWSHEIVVMDGVTTTVKVAHVRLCHSRMMFVRAYPRETQEMVFDAHERAFAFFKATRLS